MGCGGHELFYVPHRLSPLLTADTHAGGELAAAHCLFSSLLFFLPLASFPLLSLPIVSFFLHPSRLLRLM